MVGLWQIIVLLGLVPKPASADSHGDLPGLHVLSQSCQMSFVFPGHPPWDTGAVGGGESSNSL